MTFAIAIALSVALAVTASRRGPIEALDAVTADGALFYVARDGRSVHALDLDSGVERWHVALQGVDKVQAAVIHKLAHAAP